MFPHRIQMWRENRGYTNNNLFKNWNLCLCWLSIGKATRNHICHTEQYQNNKAKDGFENINPSHYAGIQRGFPSYLTCRIREQIIFTYCRKEGQHSKITVGGVLYKFPKLHKQMEWSAKKNSNHNGKSQVRLP